MWRISSGLFVSTNTDAANSVLLQSIPITHIVNCALELPSHFPDEYGYLRLNLKDPDEKLIDRIDGTCRFIERHINVGNVLVHCNGAISRSPSVVLAYMCHNGQSLIQAAESISAILPTCPNMVFLQQICQYFGFAHTRDDLMHITGILRRNDCDTSPVSNNLNEPKRFGLQS